MAWSWILLLLATYPWLLGADLISDTLASSTVVIFVTGTCLIAPCRRLPRWQCVLFAAGAGFLFEARRPIPDGLLALSLVAATITLSSGGPLLRSTLRRFLAATTINLGACLVWYLGAAYASPAPAENLLIQMFPQLLLAALVGAASLIPIALTQNAVMDRLGIAPPPEMT